MRGRLSDMVHMCCKADSHRRLRLKIMAVMMFLDVFLIVATGIGVMLKWIFCEELSVFIVNETDAAVNCELRIRDRPVANGLVLSCSALLVKVKLFRCPEGGLDVKVGNRIHEGVDYLSPLIDVTRVMVIKSLEEPPEVYSVYDVSDARCFKCQEKHNMGIESAGSQWRPTRRGDTPQTKQ